MILSFKLRTFTIAAFAVASVLALLAGCATSGGSLPSAEQLNQQGLAADGVSVDALRRGRSIATVECAACHRFFWPHEYSPEAWPGIIRKMGNRSSLTQEQKLDVELYFVAASKSARQEVAE